MLFRTRESSNFTILAWSHPPRRSEQKYFHSPPGPARAKAERQERLSTRMLATVRPLAPITRTAVLVSYRKDVDIVSQMR